MYKERLSQTNPAFDAVHKVSSLLLVKVLADFVGQVQHVLICQVGKLVVVAELSHCAKDKAFEVFLRINCHYCR